MDIKYTIKDNFLNQADYENIKKIILGDEFPWYFQEGIDFKPDLVNPTCQNFWFFWGHTFFRREIGPTSTFYKILDPLLKKLDVKALVRIKANLFSNRYKMEQYQKHADYPFKHKTALFSLNTCNGFTTLADDTKIESVGNRDLLFDGSSPHAASSCTDAKARWNININYF